MRLCWVATPFIDAKQVVVIEKRENSLLIGKNILTGNKLLLEMIRYLNNTPVPQVRLQMQKHEQTTLMLLNRQKSLAAEKSGAGEF